MHVLIYTPWPVRFWNVPKPEVERLRQRFPEVRFTHAENEAGMLAVIGDVEAALSSRLNSEAVQRAGRLRWVHTSAASVTTLPLQDLLARGVAVTNSRGIQAAAMAENVIGGLLLLSRRFNRLLDAQRERQWIHDELATAGAWPWSVHGKRMTIVGMGATGKAVAQRAHAFGMIVTAIRRRAVDDAPPGVDHMAGPEGLNDALRDCDVLVIAAPYLPETDRMIGAAQLALLRRGAILINVARAKIVDQQAMIAALESGHLGGAVLDVFDREPLPAESPLWTMPNVVITPHSSGVRPDHWHDAITLFIENLDRFTRGEPLLNLVDCASGY